MPYIKRSFNQYCKSLEDFILVKKDEVIAKMLKLLGAKIFNKKLPFTPESGAYYKH